MRKWVAIGLVLVAGAVTAFVVMRPKESPVEYHKRKYLEARDGSEMSKRMRFQWAKVTKTRLRGRPTTDDDKEQMEIHERALMDLGYLEDRMYVFERYAHPMQMRGMVKELRLHFASGGRVNRYKMLEPAIARIIYADTETVVIRAVSKEMAKWDKIAKKFRAVPLAKSDSDGKAARQRRTPRPGGVSETFL